MPNEREIIFEFLRVGAAVKVTVVDVATGIEVSVVGDPAAGEAALKQLARQKLEYVRAKRGGR
jgi:phage head maturation protease